MNKHEGGVVMVRRKQVRAEGGDDREKAAAMWALAGDCEDLLEAMEARPWPDQDDVPWDGRLDEDDGRE
jgi:hypothetical protein